MDRPAVSIVIPTYNRAHLIEETLETVVSQTISDIEILVIDDGSRDNTAEVMRTWCKRDSRIRYVSQPNGGVSTARNHGLRLAQGNFIAFLDSDDLWSAWKLQVQLAILSKRPDIGMIWTNMDAIDESGKLLETRFLRTMYAGYRDQAENYPFTTSTPLSAIVESTEIPSEVPADTVVRSGRILREMVFGNLVHTSTVLLRRSIAEAVGFFDETMRRAGEDYDYHLRTCALTDVAYLDISTMLYRIGMGDQITHASNNLYFARSYLRSVQPYLKTSDLLNSHDRHSILASAHRWLGEQLLQHGQRTEALKHLVLSLRHQPASIETVKLVAKSSLPGGLVRQFQRWRRRVVGGGLAVPGAS